MFFRILTACLAFCGFLHAQEKKPEVRFLAERVPQGLGQMILAAGDIRSAAFDMPSNHLSEPMSAPGREFKIRSVQPDVALATVKLPDDGKSFIAVLVPDPKGGYQSILIRSDDSAFKAGDVYFFNHADKVVLGYVGTAKFTLDPSSGKFVHPAGARTENFYDVGFGVREEKQDRVLSTVRWPVDPQVRSYVFFFINPTTKRLDFRAVDEFVAPEEKSG